MEHLKLRFTCGGLFDINLKYFGGVNPSLFINYNNPLTRTCLQLLVTIFGYIIILIQFKVQAIAENRYKKVVN